jgi:hypothetical protein
MKLHQAVGGENLVRRRISKPNFALLFAFFLAFSGAWHLTSAQQSDQWQPPVAIYLRLTVSLTREQIVESVMNPARVIAGLAIALVCTSLSGCGHTEPCTVEAQSNRISIPVPSGMLAVSLGYSEAVDGTVHPGSRVDVVLVTSSDRGLPLTTTVLRNIEVAAIVPGTPQNLTTVTLLTSPKNAERLARATQRGYIHLRLRE